MELLKVLPALLTGAIVVIVFFVMGALLMAWGVYSAKPLSEEEEELDRFYEELDKSKKR
jgi:hypothetical protein